MLRRIVLVLVAAWFGSTVALTPMATRTAAADGVTIIHSTGNPYASEQVGPLREGDWVRFGNFVFYEAGGGHFRLGAHTNAQGYLAPPAHPDPSRHGVGVTGGEPTGSVCDGEDRTFIVDQVEYSGNTLTRFHARLFAWCSIDGADVEDVVAVVAFNSTIPVVAHNPDNATVFEPELYVGERTLLSMRVGNPGDQTITFSPAAFSGPDASIFAVVNDGCAAAPLAPAAWCTIDYGVAPNRSGSAKASLELVSDFNRWAGRAERVPLEVIGRPLTDVLPEKSGNTVQPINPARLLDTREANGVPGTTPLGATPVTVQIAGRGGIPWWATGVIANVTVTEPTTAGFITVHPSGFERPTVSNINFLPGQTVANLSTLALGDDGAVVVFNSSGQTHVVLDVVAWLEPESLFWNDPGSVFTPAGPVRVLDTRDEHNPLGPGEARQITVPSAPVPYGAFRAALVNITAVDPTAPTFITTYAAGQPRPFTSTLNVEAGQIRANLALVQLDEQGNAMFYNNSGSADLVIDLVGLFIADAPTSPKNTGRIVLLEPFRDFDSREGGGPLPAGAAWGFEYPPTIADLPVGGIVYNLTVTEPTAPGFVTMFPGDARAIPATSTANFVPGQTVANQAWSRLPQPPNNAVVVYNGSGGQTHVILDIQAVILA